MTGLTERLKLESTRRSPEAPARLFQSLGKNKISQKERNVSVRDLAKSGRRRQRFGDLIATAAIMQPVFALARKIAGCDVTTLIAGETGTGKELLARGIHGLSSRSSGPFAAFSCASLPVDLADDELFGHERGAFTGAVTARARRFEAAQGGTLLLDEIGDLPLTLQARLLRLLQQRTFERLGSNTLQKSDIRLLCASHRDLAAMVKQGTFRQDLYYRLNVVELRVPALRERREDIMVLAEHFLWRFARQFQSKAARFSCPALQALDEYHWPGNVRQLENVIQHAVVLAEGATIELRHLPVAVRLGSQPARISS